MGLLKQESLSVVYSILAVLETTWDGNLQWSSEMAFSRQLVHGCTATQGEIDMRRIILEPGDATMYIAVFDVIDDRAFFAFCHGDDNPMIGFLWPIDMGYISYSYFMDKMGAAIGSPWTRGVAYLVLLHFLSLEPGRRDLEKEPLRFIVEPGRLKDNWMHDIPQVSDLA
jgi:hypothetical protein